MTFAFFEEIGGVPRTDFFFSASFKPHESY
jgi:hypothetical protein